ncbi:MAG: GNAT family N-acetyltransferase [Stellaceae bacterium]
MSITLRRGALADAEACGRIAFEAFKTISSAHNFPWDFPTPDTAVELMRTLLTHPGFYPVVAEEGGAVIGSNFVDERGPIAGIGPITVAPAAQNRSIGRRLMQAILEQEARRGAAGVRLLQSAYHNRSLCLYTKLGFASREMCSKMGGPPLGLKLAGYHVRPATIADLDACNALCRQVHGHARSGELSDAIRQGSARLVEHLGRVTGYASALAFYGHAVALTNPDLKALIGAASGFEHGGFLLPTRNGELFGWCLEHGLRLVHQMTLMTTGLYNEPAGAYLPSVLY